MKKLFEIKTKTIVAIGLGAALFAVLFMFIKIPSGIPETQLQTAYGIGAFFAALFGPVAGAAIAFIGHAVSDSVQYGSAWWSWVIASSFSCFVVGFLMPKLHVDEGSFKGWDIVLFNVVQVIGNFLSWAVIAPFLDVVVYSEAPNLVIVQGVLAAVSNSMSMGIIGSLLLYSYSKTKTAKGSLVIEED